MTFLKMLALVAVVALAMTVVNPDISLAQTSRFEMLNQEGKTEVQSPRGTQPNGLGLGVAPTIHLITSFPTGDGITITPLANLMYIPATGFGFEIAAGLLKEGRQYAGTPDERADFEGLGGRLGIVYRARGRMLLLKAGASAFGGSYDESSGVGGIGVYGGVGALLKAVGPLAFQLDALGHIFRNTSRSGNRLALSVGAGIVFLLTPQ